MEVAYPPPLLSPRELADTFNNKNDSHSAVEYLEALRKTYNFTRLLVDWVQGKEFFALSKAVPFLSAEEKNVFHTIIDFKYFAADAWTALCSSDLSPETKFFRASNVYSLLSSNDLRDLLAHGELSHGAMTFLIAKLEGSEKNNYLRTLRRNISLSALFPLLRGSLRWLYRDDHTLHLAGVLMALFNATTQIQLLEDTAKKNPRFFIPFLCHLPREQMGFLQALISNTLILKGLSAFSSSSYRDCQNVLGKLRYNNFHNLASHVLSIRFSSPITGTAWLPLTTLTQSLGMATPQMDTEGYDNFQVCYQKGIQEIPPLTLAFGALDPHLNRWLIDASRLFNEEQLKHFLWALPYPLAAASMPYFKVNLKGSCLEAALSSLPPKLRNQALDLKVAEVSHILKEGQETLATLEIDSKDDETNILAMLTVAGTWEQKLNALLSHPDSLPFWGQSENNHSLASYKPSVTELATAFEVKTGELRNMLEKPISNKKTLKEAPPPYLTETLKTHLGGSELSDLGIKYEDDLELLGVTRDRIREFEAFEIDFLDDVPLTKVFEWEKLKWGEDLDAWKKFYTENGGLQPERLINPFSPLIRYLRQPELDKSWSVLRKKSIFTLSTIQESCLIEDLEELFDLKSLADKLSS